MGIDIHGLNFLRYAKEKKEFGDVMTIGRQGLDVIEPIVKEIIKTNSDYKSERYCEELLNKYFGATKVESVDNSNYEGATYVHNMNEPLTHNLIDKFDTVFDGGCLEHIYNAPQALKNCSLFCKPGGQILHVLPANNWCGHGFWQFSPELFFSLYSKENGYEGTQVFMADLSNTKQWFQVKQPTNGQRANIRCTTELYVLVRTVLKSGDFNHTNVQQSDYVFEWEGLKESEKLPVKNENSIKKGLKQIPYLYKLLSPMYRSYLKINRNEGLNKNNASLSLIEIKNLIDKPT
jgi:hypothetical protein